MGADEDEILRRTRASFGAHAAGYRTSRQHGDPTALARMVDLVAPEPHEAALDVAAGGGHTGVALAPRVSRVIALDATGEMLRETRALAIERGAARLWVVQGDAHALPFGDRSFDIVACRIAPHHFADVRRAAREWLRVLGPAGRLYLYDTSCPDGEAAEAFANRLEWLRDPSHVRVLSRAGWRAVLEEVGFEVRHEALWPSRYVLSSWFDRIGTPEERRAMVLEALRAAPPALAAQFALDLDSSEPSFCTAHAELCAVRP